MRALGEPTSPTGVFLALLGFCGVALICGFAWNASGPEMIAGLASAVLFACAYASMKSIANTEHPVAISFYFHVWCTLAGLVLSRRLPSRGNDPAADRKAALALSSSSRGRRRNRQGNSASFSGDP